ncbi:hypothetical protein [Cohaesibacter haloalkalitolerans]|uniref:hypothetical protein n=1 Tax=Cohaesibacter haloalkalitolerans TaxID=1162980 RepID=UPI0013C4FB39|nr:hypothetical protein [Cohaesibacter haloalkalitolerans]
MKPEIIRNIFKHIHTKTAVLEMVSLSLSAQGIPSGSDFDRLMAPDLKVLTRIASKTNHSRQAAALSNPLRGMYSLAQSSCSKTNG